MTLYLILMYFASLALGYVLNFTRATLSIGRSLSTADTPTGFQDAITPPRFSTFALAIYVLCFGGLTYGFWAFGWVIGLGVVIGFFVSVGLNMAMLPKSEGEHLRKIIVHSMINRHADYVKAGDSLRASAMGELLARLGFPVEEFIVRIKNTSR